VFKGVIYEKQFTMVDGYFYDSASRNYAFRSFMQFANFAKLAQRQLPLYFLCLQSSGVG